MRSVELSDTSKGSVSATRLARRVRLPPRAVAVMKASVVYLQLRQKDPSYKQYSSLDVLLSCSRAIKIQLAAMPQPPRKPVEPPS